MVLRNGQRRVRFSLRKEPRLSFRTARSHERLCAARAHPPHLGGTGYGARRDRKPFRYQAFVPDRVGDWDRPLAARAADAVASATAALSAFEAAEAGHDLESLAAPLLRSEALGSSFIEGLRASNKRLALAAYEPVAVDDTARAVLGNVRAMGRAVEIGTARRRLRLDDVLDIHRTLLEGTTEARHAGNVRQDQNWIGGRGLSPADAAFVPPPDDRVRGLLDDLVDFVNLDDLPGIAQAAIAHAQFETIHPFGDGNGRVGRCLIHVVFRRRGLTPLFVPPISVVLATNARRYIAGLVDFREGRVDDWIGVFADATTTAAEAAKRLWNQIDDLLAELIERTGSPRRLGRPKDRARASRPAGHQCGDRREATRRDTSGGAGVAESPAGHRRARAHSRRPPPGPPVDQRRTVPALGCVRARPRSTGRRRTGAAWTPSSTARRGGVQDSPGQVRPSR